jgi:hypothetical protein
LAIQKSEEAAKAKAEMNEASVDAKWAIKGIASKKGRIGIRVNEQGEVVDKSQTRSVTYDEAFTAYDTSVNKMIDARSAYLNAKNSGAANVKELE